MGIRKFWASLEALSDNIWAAADGAWKVQRWIASSTAVLAVYGPSKNPAVLCLGIALAVIGVGSLFALIYRWSIRGLTEKGKSDEGPIALFLAIGLFLLSIGVAIAVWSIVASLYLQFLHIT